MLVDDESFHVVARTWLKEKSKSWNVDVQAEMIGSADNEAESSSDIVGVYIDRAGAENSTDIVGAEVDWVLFDELENQINHNEHLLKEKMTDGA